VKCGLYDINLLKKQSKCYTWTESGPKNVPRPNRSDVGLKRSRTRTWTCTNTIHWTLIITLIVGAKRNERSNNMSVIMNLGVVLCTMQCSSTDVKRK